jgi:ribosome-associated protein
MEEFLTERFIRSSGPGGQNVNKVATAVELRYHVSASDLPDDVKSRLRALAGSRLTAGDEVVIVAREHRTQAQNRAAARARLDALIARASRPPRRRRATKASAAERKARLESKRRRSTVKRTRGRPAADD